MFEQMDYFGSHMKTTGMAVEKLQKNNYFIHNAYVEIC